jgi:acetyl esterase/lipase
MRPLLLLLAAVTAFAAEKDQELIHNEQLYKLFDMAPAGSAALDRLPALYHKACSGIFTMDAPSPAFRLQDLAFLAPGRKERLDVYLPYAHPSEISKPKPAVLFIHGGGFVGGDKGEYRTASVCTDLTRAGYVVVSCNYILGPKDKPGVWPRNIADCRDAVRWMRANADKLSLDPSRIAVAGGSAGGYLALMVGLSDDKTGPGGDPNAKHSAAVDAVIDMYGVVNFSKHGKGDVPGVPAEGQAAYLPENQCDENDPPVLIFHGTDDKIVDIAQSQSMAAALSRAKTRYDFVTVEGAPHTFDLRPRSRQWSRVSERWGLDGLSVRREQFKYSPSPMYEHDDFNHSRSGILEDITLRFLEEALSETGR